MGAFITALQAELTAAALWAELSPAAVLIASLVLFAFGYWVVTRVIKGASKGKARI